MNNNRPEHPEAGEVLAVSVDGKLYINPTNKKYLESLSKSKTLRQLEDRSVKAIAGFKTPKVINNEKSEREQAFDRLCLMQNQAARLKKQLDSTNKIIEHIKKDLGC